MSRKPKMSERVNLAHCPVCSLRMSKFHCVDCVISGNFILSRSDNSYETFSEKSIRLFALTKDILEIKSEIEEKNKIVWKTESIKEEIELSRIRAKYLREAVKKNMIEKSQKLDHLTRALLLSQHSNSAYSNISDVKASKDKLEADVCVMKEQLKQIQIDLEEVKSKFILKLKFDIFPVELFQIQSSSSNQLLSPMMEAMETSLSQEDWVTMEATSSYSQKNRMMVSLVQTPKSLACQFTNMIAAILGRHLPAEVSLLDWNNDNLANSEAKLDRNVMSLCMLLGVEQSSVREGHILHNIRQIIVRIREGDDIVVKDSSENSYDNIFSDSDGEWESVTIETTDQDWEKLDETIDEEWESVGMK